jgi:aminopeptidase N
MGAHWLEGAGQRPIKRQCQHGVQTVYIFTDSDLLPTYLFSFKAGKYTRAQKQIRAYNAEFFYRETDPGNNVVSTLRHMQTHYAFWKHGLASNIFSEVGFAAIPDFQFGGIEHP